jgi:peptidoglycan/xylan/chitin deacetylase (PgdA/CDA1 family)
VLYNFLFHRVHPVHDPLWDPMRPELFERCIRYINKHFQVLLLEDLLIPAHALKPGNKYASISFDDGYKDNLEYAAPILDRYNCKASFYIVTDCIDQNKLTWTHILEHAFLNTDKKAVQLDFDFLPEHLRVDRLKDKSIRIRYINLLKPYLRVCSHENRKAIINRVQECLDDVAYPQLMMSWEDVRQLQSAGHRIGSHTVSHSVLNTITDEKTIMDEMLLSGKMIEQELGAFPVSLSYPLGKYNNTVIQLTRAAGYQLGIAVGQQPCNPAPTSLFEIPRIELYNEPWWKVRMRMNGSLERIKRQMQSCRFHCPYFFFSITSL